jgi:outer membrane biogenesis lipoprotein LolB
MQRTSRRLLLAILPAALLTACASAPAPTTAAAASGAIDNSALQRSEFRAHQATYGLVYRLPADATAIMDSQSRPWCRNSCCA